MVDLLNGQLVFERGQLSCNFPVLRSHVFGRCHKRRTPRWRNGKPAGSVSLEGNLVFFESRNDDWTNQLAKLLHIYGARSVGGRVEGSCSQSGFQDQYRQQWKWTRNFRWRSQEGWQIRPDAMTCLFSHCKDGRGCSDRNATARGTCGVHSTGELFERPFLKILVHTGVLLYGMKSCVPRISKLMLASLSHLQAGLLLHNICAAASMSQSNYPRSDDVGFMARILVPSLNFSLPDWRTSRMLERISYMTDVLLERHPMSYVIFLIGACLILIVVGGFFFYKTRPDGQTTLDDAMWDAWGCVCASSMHLKERSAAERTTGLCCALGGLLFYSLLTGTMMAHFKNRIDFLREGARSKVMEQGHIVICGANNHLSTILHQLNKSHELAIRDGATHARKQKVLLLTERPRKETEKLISFIRDDLPYIEMLTRSGSLTNTSSFQRVAADKARSVILLANKDDMYESDADIVLSVLALQPLLENSSGNFVVEVSKGSTADLLKSLLGVKVSPVQNLAAKLFVQCSRQRGLIDVYQQLLDHGKEVDINLRSYPNLAGIPYRHVRRGFSEAVVCGMIREGKLDFHPKDFLILQESDKLLLICPKNTHKDPPHELLETAKKYRETMAHLEKSSSGAPAVYDYDTLLSKDLGNSAEKHEKALSKTAGWFTPKKERLVMLGWRPGVSEMVLEYDDYVGPGSELIILAEAPIDQRIIAMDRRITRPLKNVKVIHKIGNPMSRTDLKSAIMGRHAVFKTAKSTSHHGHPQGSHPSHQAEVTEQLPLSIVVIADKGWHVGDASKPDKQSVFALLLAESLCKKHHVKVTSLVAEFVDTKLGKQVVRSQRSLAFIGTSELTGLVTSQVTEHSELNDVWTELLNSWGNEIYVKDIGNYLTDGEAASFSELSERAALRTEVAIGYGQGDQTVLNPSDKRVPLTFKHGDSLVVISEFE